MGGHHVAHGDQRVRPHRHLCDDQILYQFHREVRDEKEKGLNIPFLFS